MKIKYVLPTLLALVVSCSNPISEKADLAAVPEATENNISHVEPLSWWTGMKLPLQVMVNGQDISSYDIRIVGPKGIDITKVHPADSPNYVFLDVRISSDCQPGTIYFVFSKEGQDVFKYPYEIAARREGSASRPSYTTADMIYLLMPDRFANGDPTNDSTSGTTDKADRNEYFGRHGGDLRGMIDHLDYLVDLGITAIWPTPLLLDDAPHGSYHGYAAADYYHIDPRFGDNELYREFVNKSHEKGMKVIMDIVTNHCGIEHWWMKDLPFEDWIHQFPEYTGTNHCFAANMDTHASQQDLKIQESGWFTQDMVDMNLDNPYMLQYFKQWGIWWIEYADLDGFRVDTYPYNEKVPMSEWCAAITNEYENFNIVGECWTDIIPQLAYWQKDHANLDGFNSNLPSIMDFPLFEAMRAALSEPEAQWNQGMKRVYQVVSSDFVYQDMSHMLIFPSNHDTDRMGDAIGKDAERMKLALIMTATMRGIPQIFSGDEMMFVSADPRFGHGSLRVDFPGGWAGDQENLFTEEGRQNAIHNTDGLLVKKGFAADMYDFSKKLFNWRKTKDVIHNGKTLHFTTHDNTYAYFRYNEEEAVFVFINNSTENKHLPWERFTEIAENVKEGRDIFTGKTVELSANTVVGPAQALVVEIKGINSL